MVFLRFRLGSYQSLFCPFVAGVGLGGVLSSVEWSENDSFDFHGVTDIDRYKLCRRYSDLFEADIRANTTGIMPRAKTNNGLQSRGSRHVQST
jgi:hypothetical protein